MHNVMIIWTLKVEHILINAPSAEIIEDFSVYQ